MGSEMCIRDRFNEDDSFLFKLDLGGLEADCVGCGIHIHSGFTCDDASLVGGHHWDKDIFGATATDDPWNAESYFSDSVGVSTSGFVIDSGFGLRNNKGRAVVVHASDGSRIAW